VVLGSGIEALLVSWVFRQHPGFHVRVIGARSPAHHLELPLAHRSTRHSAGLARFLRFLDVPYASFYPRDGILLRGEIEKFPEVLAVLPAERAAEVFARYTRKAVGFDIARAIPRTRKDRPRCLRWAPLDLIETLMRGLDFVLDEVEVVQPDRVLAGRAGHRFDFLIITEPLIDLQTKLFFPVPPMSAKRRTIAVVTAHEDRQFARWDSVLTPFTPGQAAHRVSTYEHGYAVEMVGRFDPERLTEDLRFFFPTKCRVDVVRSDLWTVPVLAGDAEWMLPANVAMLGAEAQCAPITLDHVFDEAYRLLRVWSRRGGAISANA